MSKIQDGRHLCKVNKNHIIFNKIEGASGFICMPLVFPGIPDFVVWPESSFTFIVGKFKMAAI